MAKVRCSYICEICNTEYLDENGANDCASSHYTDLEIDNMDYKHHEKWPRAITLINPENGTKQVYVKA